MPRQQCQVTVSRQTQCHISSATSDSATSDKVPRQQCHVSNMTGLPGQLPNESLAAYKQRFQAQIEAEEQRQLALEAAAAEQLQLQADADADAQARRKEAQDLLQRHEANSIDRLKFWHFEPNGDEATPEEKHKEFLSKLVTRLLYACNYQRSELERQYQDLTQQHQELAQLRRMVQSHEDATRALNARLLDLEQAVPGPAARASSSAPSSRQLEDRVDHAVAMLGDISTFAAPTTTISSQLHTLKTEVQQLQTTNADGNPKMYKMPIFNLERFDDYTQQDLVLWWEAFTTQLRILPVAKYAYIGALFLNSKGGCQTWLSHLATSQRRRRTRLEGPNHMGGTDTAVEEAVHRRRRAGTRHQPLVHHVTGQHWNTATRDWLTEWQKIAAVPNLELPFTHLRREFYNRSCAALSQTLGDCEQYSTFAEIIDKAREIIKTNRSAAYDKSPWQPTYVEKLGKLSFAEGEATPPSTPPDSTALLAASCTSGEDANVASPRYTYEAYAVHLVPPLDQSLHVQQSTACTVSSPSTTDSAASPQSIAGDSTSWSRLEELDPLTFTDFQWMPVPSTGRLPKPHCNVLMTQLRDYLHTAVPAPLMDAGVEVVDLHVYIAKIDREFKTQRYDDIDVPLLYVRIQIGEATCSALIDCGASRNYISQDFMLRAGFGPRVRRKSQPTQVTLADGHTHKSIDRCIDAVPVYFAPHASETVSFDILNIKFDMILGMSWLRSKDHPVNFFNRTVQVRDRNGLLVPCTVPLPHPSISCHVVSAASMRASIIRDDIEEMGVCFPHTLPPHDASSTDSPSDPRITELLDAYSDVFEGPHGVVPDRPIRHEIILEDGAVPPRWIRPSSSPYGAPVLFVRKKYKDLRLCIDDRKLNAQTIRNAGPLPRIDNLLERLGDAQFFSKLDLKSGYHQLQIRKEDRYKTAFKTRYGHFEWLVMPFGLTNAPTTFQAAMTTEFRHMLDRFVLIYLDDILVYSRSLDEHVEHLRTVSERLRQAKYKASRDKCEFAQQELEYLGHYVTPQGICPLADKIEALRVWLEPTNTTDVRSFMGLAGYYQRFITGYSRIAAPMTRLQSPKVPFVFNDNARRSFQGLKTAMLMAPVLSIYDPTLLTRVTTDASGCGIRAVLEQHDNDDWHPVEYFSHKVPPINSLDDARKTELLASVMALKRWRHLLLGRRRFTWVTDNNPLTYYKTQNTVSSTIGRWIWVLSWLSTSPVSASYLGPAIEFLEGLWQPVTALVLVGVAILLSSAQDLGREREITYSVLRAFLQLLAIGYILEAIFFLNSVVWIFLDICFMIAVAAYTAAQRAKRVPHSFLIALTAISTGTVTTISMLVLLRVFPFKAQYLIPTAGMMVGSSMSVTGMTLNQIREQIKQNYAQVEVALALGATPRQAVRNQVKRAFTVGLGPLLDSAKTMGIVTLPGAMTGLILGGTSPLEAVKLQIVVVNFLVGTSAISSLLATYLTWPLFFTPTQQFRPGAFDDHHTHSTLSPSL
ncbi:hypothetical protein CBR_g49882 [Chara braunii]|uniref:Reverse transcriptase domain-containing protein n=1 Tax=Chara braunii TaxID=69332 RepID=A0A388JPB5_CHABU|nr:hypothetical protein CBR_g49882 [Chara braunii]|eukprot:GBG59617.1 hypothetical protein CBR_g49882 [Chara braunii]